MIAPYKIEWMGQTSLEMDCWTGLSFDGDDGTVETHLSKEAIASESYNGALKRVSNYKWSESFTFSITFVKQDYSDFTDVENRKMLKWLTGSNNPAFINIYKDDSEVVEWSALGNFVNVSQYKLGNGRIVGYVAEWESLTPYAFSDLYTVTKRIYDATDNKIIIEIDTDDNKPVYPRITINHGYGDTPTPHSVVNIPEDTTLNPLSDMVENTVYYNGTTYYWKTAPETDEAYFNSSTINPNLNTTSVRFINKYTDFLNQSKVLDAVVVKNNTPTEKVVIDGANKIVSTDSVRRIFGDDFNWQWLELYDGKNEITIEGNCEVTLEWRSVVKVGEY